MQTTDLEERIRARAHEIWENEGRPEGAEARHWEQARAEIAGQAGEAEDGDAETPTGGGVMTDVASEISGEAETKGPKKRRLKGSVAE